jgi:HK97 family phage major capsid protein
MAIQDKIEKRAKLVADARKFLENDNVEAYDKAMADADGLKRSIDQETHLAKVEAELNETRGRKTEVTELNPNAKKDEEKRAYDGAFDNYVRYGANTLSGDEVRAMQVGTDSEGTRNCSAIL